MAQIAICTSLACGSVGNITARTLDQVLTGSGSSWVNIFDQWNQYHYENDLAISKASSNAWLTVSTTNLTVGSMQAAQAGSVFHGSYKTADMQADSPIIVRREYPKEKVGQLKYKDFVKRKQSGEILLNAMRNRSIEVVAHPGTLRGIVTQGATRRLPRHFEMSSGSLYSNQYGRWHLEETDLYYSDRPRTDQIYTVYTVPGRLTTPVSEGEIKQWIAKTWRSLDELEVDSGLVTEARAEANAGLLDLTTTLAEVPETIKMIVEACRLVLMKYLEYKRKVDVLRSNRISSPDLLSQIADLWMQYRYGIMPNVYTIQDGLSYLQSTVVAYQTIRKGTREFVFQPDPIGDWTAPEVDLFHRVFLKNRFDVKALSRSGAFLKTNLLSTAWELIPLSFVIDWVLNVGDYLSSLWRPVGSVQEACQASWQSRDVKIRLSNPEYLGADIDVLLGYYRSEIIQPNAHVGLNIQLGVTWKRALDAIALSWGMTSTDFKRSTKLRWRL